MTDPYSSSLPTEAFLRIRSAIRTLIEAKNRVVDEIVTVFRGQIPEWLRPRRFLDQVQRRFAYESLCLLHLSMYFCVCCL